VLGDLRIDQPLEVGFKPFVRALLIHREILASAYSLTTGAGILEALVRAAQRGVDVRLVPAAHRRKSTVNGFGRLFWGVLDALDYGVTDARLRIVDAACGPEPETQADRQRAREREGLERALGLSPGAKHVNPRPYLRRVFYRHQLGAADQCGRRKTPAGPIQEL
jgi:hypothetical protein